jgi:hypothetical protein
MPPEAGTAGPFWPRRLTIPATGRHRMPVELGPASGSRRGENRA